jgi:hypothetical protein
VKEEPYKVMTVRVVSSVIATCYNPSLVLIGGQYYGASLLLNMIYINRKDDLLLKMFYDANFYFFI